ncbi:MAG: bacteriophage Gp15 family protein [Bacilli bacterium]
MNILIDLLPVKVEINKVEYNINTDFRYWINYTLVLKDDSLTEEEKILTVLQLVFKDSIPKNLQEAFEKIKWFYNCGEEIKTSNFKPIGKNTSEKIFDYEYDANYIYSAFMTQYNIDLQDVELHWWKFQALFKALDDNLLFSKIQRYRAINLKDIKDSKEKAFYKEMKKLYALPKEEIIVENEYQLNEWKTY